MLKTRLKTVFAICLIFGLVGCTISSKDINKGLEKCEKNGGLKELHYDGPSNLTAYCNNGAKFPDIRAN